MWYLLIELGPDMTERHSLPCLWEQCHWFVFHALVTLLSLWIKWINSWKLSACNCFWSQGYVQISPFDGKNWFPTLQIHNLSWPNPLWDQRHSFPWSLGVLQLMALSCILRNCPLQRKQPCLRSHSLPGQNIEWLVTAELVLFPTSAVALKGHPRSRGPNGN